MLAIPGWREDETVKQSFVPLDDMLRGLDDAARKALKVLQSHELRFACKLEHAAAAGLLPKCAWSLAACFGLSPRTLQRWKSGIAAASATSPAAARHCQALREDLGCGSWLHRVSQEGLGAGRARWAYGSSSVPAVCWLVSCHDLSWFCLRALFILLQVPGMSRQRAIAANFDEQMRCPPGMISGRAVCVVCARHFWTNELYSVVPFQPPDEDMSTIEVPAGAETSEPSAGFAACLAWPAMQSDGHTSGNLQRVWQNFVLLQWSTPTSSIAAACQHLPPTHVRCARIAEVQSRLFRGTR